MTRGMKWNGKGLMKFKSFQIHIARTLIAEWLTADYQRFGF